MPSASRILSSLSSLSPAQAPRRTRGHVTTYGVGRTCADPGCRTILSRYNDAQLCWYHVDGASLAGRRRP